jgi:hypothetical protein
LGTVFTDLPVKAFIFVFYHSVFPLNLPCSKLFTQQLVSRLQERS